MVPGCFTVSPSTEQERDMFKEFKDFAMGGNVVDMAGA